MLLVSLPSPDRRSVMKSSFSLLTFLLIAAASSAPAQQDPLAFLPQRDFVSRDSLDPGDEDSPDARQCLSGLVWMPASFQVTCEEADRGLGAALVRFPTPIPTGDSTNDNVSMEWYLARDKDGKPIKAPAVVVVHESGRSMPVGRLFARGLNQKQLHTFLIHLPHYGKRRGKTRPDGSNILTLMRQAIADVRRARDAVSVLPFVDSSHIALQGTSLGGFVSATAAGLDRGYDSVFLMLAGGDLFDLIQTGKRDTEKVRQRLEEAGMTDDDVRKMAHVIEPTRLAHRLDRNRTWLYSGKSDTVVPLKNANVLAEAVKLEKPHHILMNANHYSGIIYLPFVLRHISDQIEKLSAADGKSRQTAD
jgi:hypothetical protein